MGLLRISYTRDPFGTRLRALGQQVGDFFFMRLVIPNTLRVFPCCHTYKMTLRLFKELRRRSQV
jgi:hypothetical protein